MLASVELMRRGDLNLKSYLAGLVLAMAGLLCKVYFAWPAFAGAAYVFFWRDWQRGLAYGFAAIVVTALTIAIAGRLFPGYIAFVLIANLEATDYDFGYLLRQSFDWVIFDLPLIAALIFLLLRRWRGFSIRRDPGLLTAMAGFGLLAIVGKLGGHPGAHLSYIFQLLSPFVAATVLASATGDPGTRRIFRIALPIAVIANGHWFPLDFQRFRVAGESFADVRHLINGSQQVLATTEFAGLLALEGRPLIETGHAAYLNYALESPAPNWLEPLVPTTSVLEQEWRRIYCGVRSRVDAGTYDVALIGPFPSALIPFERLKRRYHLAYTFIVDMPWALQKWPVEVWQPNFANGEKPTALVQSDPCKRLPPHQAAD